MRFRIDPAVLERFPELTIGVVVACGIDNRQPSVAVSTFFKEQVEQVREMWSLQRLDDDPRIIAWRDAYRAFGAKPKKHRSSVENLIQMAIKGIAIRPINAAVDIYNAISLKHAVPVGGDDLDRVVGNIRLTVATGEEQFIPLNSSEATAPKPGEIIYRDDEDVLCRRWNWRECDKSKMTEASTNLCLVVEGLPPLTGDDIGRIASELAEAIEGFCGGRTTMHILDRDASEAECM